MTRKTSATWAEALALALAAVAGAAAAATGLCGCDAPAPPPPSPRQEVQPQRLATATILVGALRLEVEVADDDAARRTGLMHRRTLGPDEGMLFVFPDEAPRAFWMKDCHVDLDLAYIRGDGTIAQIERLRAHNLAGVRSLEPARFALEMPAGWFAAHGFGPGARVSIPPYVAARAH